MDRSPRRLLVVVVFVLSVAVAGSAGAAGVTSGPAVGAPAGPGSATGVTIDHGGDTTHPVGITRGSALQQSFDRTQYAITVHENGSARWTFRFERPLENETERQDFESFATEFNANETTLYTNFRNDASALVAEGANFTGRDMRAEGFAREARVESGLNTVGVVEMTFVWTEFAVVEGDRVVVGDVFEDGLYIYQDQSLVIRPGDGLAFQSVAPNGTLSSPGSLRESDSVTWQGEREFTDNRPQVVLVPPSAATTEPGGGGTPGGGGDGAPTDGGLPVAPIVGALIVLLAGAAGFVWYRRSDGTADADGRGTGPDGGGAGGAGGAAAGGSGGGSSEPAVPDEELLADEDRVVRMLRENGGRMKQVKIVEETGWSKSKVSMLLSEMEDEGTISKLRVGRENVISLAGHEPPAASSPFDDEKE
jgi:hypothetical protein